MFEDECSICDGQKDSSFVFCEVCNKEDVGWLMDKLVKKINRLKEYEERLIEKLVEYQEKLE